MLIAGRTHITLSYTWLLQGSKAFLFFFMVYITFRYGHIHLGRKGDKSEFTTRSYFSMIFSSGTGPALLFYSASEPLFHQHGHFFAQTGYRSQDEIDMFAINLTVSNWSISTWLVFTVVAVSSSLAVHRFGLPLTFRSCFYPIFGAYTWGWMGDCIDGMAIVIMILSICTMMCLASTQIVTGLQYLEWIDSNSTDHETTAMQKVAVWIVTFISTASVISGLHYGIQYMSMMATSLGFILLFLLFLMDDTKLILNILVQEMGYYLQHTIFEINFWTDGFGQLREGEGRAIDGKASDALWMS
jgi:choline/glycine/proline betaine transport protein